MIVDEVVIFVVEYVVRLCVQYVKFNLGIVWVEFFWQKKKWRCEVGDDFGLGFGLEDEDEEEYEEEEGIYDYWSFLFE